MIFQGMFCFAERSRAGETAAAAAPFPSRHSAAAAAPAAPPAPCAPPARRDGRCGSAAHAAAPGSRVTAVTIGGAALDAGTKYKLATNDYMARGGDGYKILRKGKILLGDLDGKLMANDVMAFIRAAGSVEAQVEGRITVK